MGWLRMAAAPALVKVDITAGPFFGGGAGIRNLIISSAPNVLITLWHNDQVALGQGINLNQGTIPNILRWHDYGDWIRQPLFAIASVATTVGVVAVFDCEDADNDLAMLGRAVGRLSQRVPAAY